MGSTPQAPAPPDPYRTAGAQTTQNVGSSVATSVLGNPNQVGPYGSTTYSQSGENYSFVGPDGKVQTVPRYTQTTTLSPEQQRLYDQQNQIGQNVNQLAIDQSSRLSDHLGRPIDASSLPKIGDFATDRRAVEDAEFARLNPQLERDRLALENRLVNQGFKIGDEAYNNAMDEYNRQVNDQRLAVTGRGLQAMQGLYGIASDRRARGLQEMLALRNQPTNEISALMSGGQVHLPTAQGYQGGNIAAADVAGNVYNTAALKQKQYEQQMNQYNQQLAGLYGIGQAAILGGMKKWGGGLV